MNYLKNIYPLILLMLAGIGLQGQTTLSGNVSTFTDLPMAGVTLELISGASTLTTTTDEVGNYTFENVPSLTEIQLKITKADNHINGVSTLDIVIMINHILGLRPFETPNQYIAMDANKSGSITAFDLIEIRRLILGLATEFANNDAWRFVEQERLTNLTFDQTNSPEYSGNISDLYALDNNGNAILNIIGIKIGDANGNAAP